MPKYKAKVEYRVAVEFEVDAMDEEDAIFAAGTHVSHTTAGHLQETVRGQVGIPAVINVTRTGIELWPA